MATTKQPPASQAFRIAEPVDDDGDVTVVDTGTGTTFRVVDYADPMLRDRLAGRDAGSIARLDLAPADPDGLDWIVTRVRPGTPVPPASEFY